MNHPELKDAQIARLIGTTKATIEQIRHRTHWNSANLAPLDPVGLGLCSQIDLDIELHRAAKNRPVPAEGDGTLLPASVTENGVFDEGEAKQITDENLDASKVFAKLNALQKEPQGDL